MKIALISHRFNPAHMSHMLALEKLVSNSKIETFFYWNKKYWNLLDANRKLIVGNFYDCRSMQENDHVLVWAPSIKAMLQMVVLRFFYKPRLIYILHEPYESFSAYRKGGFSIGKIIQISLISLISYICCCVSDEIVAPSEKAFTHLKKLSRNLNKCTKINLMFEDESELCDLELSRTYISYIGTIAKDHAFLEFINSAIYIIDNNIFPAYQILIATKSDLPKHVVSRIAPYILNNRMVVKSGRPFTNKEINHFFQSSIVVWNAYKRSMQSGVLAKSYMFGSPVIISENNESEFFIDGKTGVKVSSSYDAVEIAESIRVVSKNFTKMSANVRSMFLDKFHYKSMEFIFLNILKRRQND